MIFENLHIAGPSRGHLVLSPELSQVYPCILEDVKQTLWVLNFPWGWGVSTSYGCPPQCFFTSGCLWPDAFKVSQLEKCLWIKQMKLSVVEAPDGACNGVFPSICLLPHCFYCPKMLLLFCHWPLTGHSGTGSPGLPHYSAQSVLYPRLQSIIIQMSQPQWRKNMQADFSPMSSSQHSLITAGSDRDSCTWRLTGQQWCSHLSKTQTLHKLTNMV